KLFRERHQQADDGQQHRDGQQRENDVSHPRNLALGRILSTRCLRHPISLAMAIVDFPHLKALLAGEGRLMALDVCSKTIGVATPDVLRSLASPLATLKRTKLAADLSALGTLVRKHEIRALAIGLPLNMDGSEGPRCQSVRQFVANIEAHGPPEL